MSEVLMTPEQRLAALQELEKSQTRNQRRVVWTAWVSVVVAGVVFALLVTVGTRQLSTVRKNRDDLKAEKTRLAGDLENIKAEIKKKQKALNEYQALVQKLPRTAIEEAQPSSPNPGTSVPRIYLQYTNPEDMQHAENIRRALQDAGYIVLGIELITTARLRVSDVRFFHDEEKQEAQKIASVLRNAGEQVGGVGTPKGYENSRIVRPNLFEVWLVARPRN